MPNKRTRNRVEAEESGAICANCGCGIADDEPRAMQSMGGKNTCILTYWHETDRACVNALTEKVRDLERVVARQAITLVKEDKSDA